MLHFFPQRLVSFSQLIILVIFFGACSDASVKQDHPNIVFLLVDDLGWNDLGCYGSTFYETPNIDRLARQGIRFTNAYASCPVCSPTRASIMTGKSPVSLNITDWIPGSDPKDKLLIGPEDRNELALEEFTMAEMLKSKDYRTAFLGKWHLGSRGFYPEDQGFDINIGGHHAGQPASYFYPYKNDRKNWDVPGLDGGEEGEYLTDRLTDESITFIEEQSQVPFFLYLAYYNVHTPIQAKPNLKIKYEGKKADTKWKDQLAIRQDKFDARTKMIQDNPSYAGMVQSVDESVGRILDKLEDLGIDKNTLVILTSDNGGLTTLPPKRQAPTSVAPLRTGKGWLYEGGIRVPAIIKWPGKIKRKSESTEPIISTDFFMTIAEVVGYEFNPESDLEGKNLLPLVMREEDLDRDAIYWHYPHYHGSNHRPSAAVRKGKYKLIEWFEDETIELYNLEEDISEENDLSKENPDKVEELKIILHDWQKKNGALFPIKNPGFKNLGD